MYYKRELKSSNSQKFPCKAGTDHGTWIKRNISNFSHANIIVVNIIWTKP